MGILRLRLLATGILAGIFLLTAGLSSASAQASESEIVDELDRTGRYLELSDSGLESAIAQANGDGIAFAWIDEDSDGLVATSLAENYVEALDGNGSRYRTVVVLLGEGFGASSSVYDQDELERALDASVDSFAAGSPGRGLDTFTESLVGSLTTATTTPSNDGGSSGGGGIGFGSILAFFAVIGGGFFGIRAWMNSRKRKKQAIVDMEDDRAEIKEQLKNNADRVISLGDRAIASGDDELIATYEAASATYQDVSQSVDAADTAAEVDALDDRIDHAEWQFEVIEAKLDGRPIPQSPAQAEAAALPPPTAEQPPPPAEEPGVITSPTTGRRYPTTTPQRRRGGGMGGLTGGLGSILGSVILGGGLGGNRSRRSQRRSGGFGMGTGSIGTRSSRSRSGGGGLGGGVLRRGGSRSAGSRTRTRSRSRSKTRGGRSFGGSKSRGGRNF